jgi:hypothetical protein
MPDGRPDAGQADPAWSTLSRLAGAGAAAAPELEHGWEVLAGGSIVGPSDIVLAHPAIGVALLQVDPHWTPDAVSRLRALLDRHGFPLRFPGHLPVIHRRLRPEHLPELPVVLHEAFGWQDPITLAPERAWVTALRGLLVAAPAPAPVPAPLPRATPAPAAVPSAPRAAPVATPPADPARPRLGAGMLALAGGGLLGAALALWVMVQPEPAAAPPSRLVDAAPSVQSVAIVADDDLAEDHAAAPAPEPTALPPVPEADAPLDLPLPVPPLAAIAEPDAPGALPPERLAPLAAIAEPDAPGALAPERLAPLAAIAEPDAPGALAPEPLPPLAAVAEPDPPAALAPEPLPPLAAVGLPDEPRALPPVATTLAAAPVTTPPPPAASPAAIAMLRRGEALLAIGDISAARRFLERAAAGGSGAAALALAGTYDPRGLAQLGARGIPPDPAQARAWYQRALVLGETAARDRMATLDAPQ